MTGTDPAERSFADLHCRGFVRAARSTSAVAGAQLHLAAATDRIRLTLHNVASTADHILATHKGAAVKSMTGGPNVNSNQSPRGTSAAVCGMSRTIWFWSS